MFTCYGKEKVDVKSFIILKKPFIIQTDRPEKKNMDNSKYKM